MNISIEELRSILDVFEQMSECSDLMTPETFLKCKVSDSRYLTYKFCNQSWEFQDATNAEKPKYGMSFSPLKAIANCYITPQEE